MFSMINTIKIRVFFTLLIGIILSIGLTYLISLRERHDLIDKFHAVRMIERADQFADILDFVPLEARKRMVAILDADKNIDLKIIHKESYQRKDDRLDTSIRIASESQHKILAIRKLEGRMCTHHAIPLYFCLCHSVDVQLRNGDILSLTFHPQKEGEFRNLSHGTWPILYLVILALLLIVLAYIVASMVAEPMQELAEAAIALGKNIERNPIEEKGPKEVRYAISAFNRMQSLIRSHILERTQMLAAITHDLQTPVTRLRLRLEDVSDNSLRIRLVEDLSAMQDMIRDGLDLASSENVEEALQPLYIGSLLDAVCADAIEIGYSISLDNRTEDVVIMAYPNKLRRCLTNILDNAIEYGERAYIHAIKDEKCIVISIRDFGPGIPEPLLEKVFDPFFRVEASRSRKTGGTGIGLTIARKIAEKHGGKLFLKNHDAGGIIAILQLPINKPF